MEKNNSFYLSGAKSANPFNSAPPNNNDKIYNNSNNIYSSGSTITNVDYYMISNLIIFKSLQKYNYDYKETIVPFSYIGFYIKETFSYTNFQTPYLKLFFNAFNNKKDNLLDSIEIFSKTFTKFIELKSIKKASFFTGLKPGEYIEVNKKFLTKEITNTAVNNNDLNEALNKIIEISKEIHSTSKEKKLKLLYIDYLSMTSDTNKQNGTVQPLKTNLNKTAKRTVIAPPKQLKEDKVTNIKLRKLNIGRKYPTSLTHSRIDSNYFAFKFTDGDRCYKLIEKYRFTSVKYSNGFEVKRKALFEEKKADFDLF